MDFSIWRNLRIKTGFIFSTWDLPSIWSQKKVMSGFFDERNPPKRGFAGEHVTKSYWELKELRVVSYVLVDTTCFSTPVIIV